MTLFRKLFFTYLLVAILALVISGGVSGYLVLSAIGRSQSRQLEMYGQQMAAILRDREWTPADLQRVQSTADTLEKGQSAHIWLVDRDGLIQMASETATPAQGGRLTMAEMDEVLAGRSVTVRTRMRPPAGGPTLAVPVYRGGEVVGAVLLSQSAAGLRQARAGMLDVILYGTLTAAAVVAAISYYISQRVSRPVAEISQAARRLAQGEFGARVAWRSRDELGGLATAFNEMAAELETLERSRKDLMATVSHELKGPLTRIAGYLEAINDGIGGAEARQQHFAIVRREVGRLTRLVNDLLDVSRLEAGRLKLHPIPCDLAPYLIRAMEVFQASAAAAGVSLVVQIPPILPIVECEPERMEQVLANLVENALAFTPPQGVVKVTAAVEQEWLVVTVTDTGPGIPPEELERVWEQFYKRDRARTPDRRGFGLGLTIVKQLTELQGGQVFAHSTLGEQTCFGLKLPLAQPK